jgi:hypothetical protein
MGECDRQMIDRRKLRVLFPCGNVSEPDCIIKGGHLTEEECILYMNGHKYWKGENGQKSCLVESVDVEHTYMVKREINNINDIDSESYECEGEYFWAFCEYNESGAVPATSVYVTGYAN